MPSKGLLSGNGGGTSTGGFGAVTASGDSGCCADSGIGPKRANKTGHNRSLFFVTLAITSAEQSLAHQFDEINRALRVENFATIFQKILAAAGRQ